jgi:hypothetical protein
MGLILALLKVNRSWSHIIHCCESRNIRSFGARPLALTILHLACTTALQTQRNTYQPTDKDLEDAFLVFHSWSHLYPHWRPG